MSGSVLSEAEGCPRYVGSQYARLAGVSVTGKLARPGWATSRQTPPSLRLMCALQWHGMNSL